VRGKYRKNGLSRDNPRGWDINGCRGQACEMGVQPRRQAFAVQGILKISLHQPRIRTAEICLREKWGSFWLSNFQGARRAPNLEFLNLAALLSTPPQERGPGGIKRPRHTRIEKGEVSKLTIGFVARFCARDHEQERGKAFTPTHLL
jgi:hypothetical protein